MITFVGAATGTTSATPPAHVVGDIMIVFAFRDGSTTNPTIGTGSPTTFTTITNTTDGTSCSVSAGWKRCASTSETTGTWTNASRLVCLIYRGMLASATPVGTFQTSNGTTNTINYPAVTLTRAQNSWFLALAGHASVDTTLETPPTNMVLRSSAVDATAETAVFDTDSIQIKNWPSTDVAISGTASNWITLVLELFADPTTYPNNYQFVRTTQNPTGDNAGILSFGERIK